MLKFQLGQKVKIHAHVERVFQDDISRIRGTVTPGKAVIRSEKEENGVICGQRTLKEGWTKRSYSGEDPNIFQPTNYVRVYLVAVNMNTMRRVLEQDIETSKEAEPRA